MGRADSIIRIFQVRKLKPEARQTHVTSLRPQLGVNYDPGFVTPSAPGFIRCPKLLQLLPVLTIFAT